MAELRSSLSGTGSMGYKTQVLWLAKARLDFWHLPPSFSWLSRDIMKSIAVFYEKIHTDLLPEIFFLIASCNIYLHFFLLLSHSNLEMMRLWHVASVTPSNLLLSLLKLLFQDYFIHLPFTLSSKFQFVSMFLVHHFLGKRLWEISNTQYTKFLLD